MELTFREQMCNIICRQKGTSSPTPTQQERKDLMLGPSIGPRGYQQDVCAWAGRAEEAAAVVGEFTKLNEPVKLCNQARQPQRFANEMIIKEWIQTPPFSF